jgi:hypothetical protein
MHVWWWWVSIGQPPFIIANQCDRSHPIPHTPPPPQTDTIQNQRTTTIEMSGSGGTGGLVPGSGSISPVDELFALVQSRTEPGPRREAELARARQLLGAHKVGGLCWGLGWVVGSVG